jgi:hypothetical protein
VLSSPVSPHKSERLSQSSTRHRRGAPSAKHPHHRARRWRWVSTLSKAVVAVMADDLRGIPSRTVAALSSAWAVFVGLLVRVLKVKGRQGRRLRGAHLSVRAVLVTMSA